MFFCVAITYAHSSCVSAESKDRYRLSTYYCELEVGSDIHMYLYDSEDEEEREVPENEVKWYTEGDDIVINESGEATAVKCSGKKKSYANIYAEYKGTTYRCEVIIFAKEKYKSDYKIVLPKNVEYFRVGKTYKLSVKGSGKKKVKWYVGTEDDYYEDTSCKYARIDNKGNLTILACKCDPDDLYVYAKIDKTITMEHIYTQPVRNKKEKKALKKLINKTSLSAKNKKEAMAHYSEYCDWDVNGHLEILNLDKCGIKGVVSLRDFRYLAQVSLEHNSITNLDVVKNKFLVYLDIDDNLIKKIDTSKNKGLMRLSADHNCISSVDFSKNPKLMDLYLSYNPIKKIDTLNGCNDLERVIINNELRPNYTLKSIDISNNLKLEYLDICDNRELESVLLPNSDALKYVFLEDCNVAELDVSKCEGIDMLFLHGNNLKRVKAPRRTSFTLSCDRCTVFEYNGEEYSAEVFVNNVGRYWFGNLYWWYTSEDGEPFPGEEDEDWY